MSSSIVNVRVVVVELRLGNVFASERRGGDFERETYETGETYGVRSLDFADCSEMVLHGALEETKGCWTS